MTPLRRAAKAQYGLERLEAASPAEVRQMAHRINDLRGGARVHAGELSALPLLEALMIETLETALADRLDDVLDAAATAIEDALGEGAVERLIAAFAGTFGADREPAGDGGAERTERRSERRRRTLAALLAVRLLNRNPALAPLRELIDDRELPADLYPPALEIVEQRIREASRGPVALAGDLIDRLEAPARAEPASIAGQLRLYLEQPAPPTSTRHGRLERALDTLAEERPRPPAGPGPIEVAAVDDGPVTYAHPPRREPAWMRELVLGARHTHVWLEQLSRTAERRIARLDAVPDAELERIVESGVTGLWLVGVWERSAVSQRIKESTGSAGAAASAYSIVDYRVADDLGGDAALEALQQRALEHGLRIGVDVVPNHFGLDSRWMREHPERFLAVDEAPFPAYSFDGPDLSDDHDVGLYLEDHYLDRSDAAVVFRHVDRAAGRERFVYHGNDGTVTPWNDTAQLDYTRADVRRAMSDQIVDLARRFPILRFDAAMTLTRLHFQRLWFPAPGLGGAVPSRSEHGMSEAEFRRRMPTEFWRDVVERVEREAPDTLLVAEAFWLMEPTFVRDFGMHRVYNSAFMHLLREGDNARFQRLLADGLERDPELVRRAVNFMTTPDEASAAEQFGRGDRYFAAATLLATLPGTPMLGHGQVAGLEEKYGMEYLAPRRDEVPDPELAERHRREIAPLLTQRGRFADVERWRALAVEGPGGHRWHDVYAFAIDGAAGRTLLVVHHAARAVTVTLRDEGEEGWQADGDGDRVRLVDRRLGVVVERDRGEVAARGLRLDLEPWQALVLRPAGDDAERATGG